jgi:beta-glucosidase-like glycosyl hydrolase/S1-C subfamily serine protease
MTNEQAPTYGAQARSMKPASPVLLSAVVVLALALAGTGTALLVSHNTSSQPKGLPVAATTNQSATTTTPTTSASTSSANTSQTFPALYRQVADGVVRVETTACNGGGVGSGFLIAPDLVATVAHVVSGAVSIVIRANGITTTGTVVGIDTGADLALVQTPTPVTGHVFALDTSQTEVGTDVGAIGYPLAGPESLTKGSISGLGRTIDVNSTSLGGLIQTDAAVNHGNSGGPLLSVNGTVVGLVDAMETDANGIGYAIPAQSAANQLQSWRQAPTPAPAGAGCDAPAGPSGITTGVTDQSGSPDGPSIAAMFTTYADGINTGDYTSAYGMLSPNAQSLSSYDAFRGGELTSYNVTLNILGVTHDSTQDSAEVAFTSVQDPNSGGHQQACSNWKMTYTLIPNGSTWLIDTANPPPGQPQPMLKRAGALAGALLVALTAACQRDTATPTNTTAKPVPTSASAPSAARATATTAAPVTAKPNPGGLSDAQSVGQLFMVYVYGSGAQSATPAQRGANMALFGVATPAEVVRRWHPGGIILINSNNLDPARPDLSSGNVDNPAQITALTAGLQQAALADTGLPLLIATDQEGGRVQRITNGVTPRPAQKALAGTDPAALTCSYYGLGRQLRALGVNQDFAPDADVVTTSAGVIGDRSFGPNPALDATDVRAAVTGLQDAWVLATLKHWPGHGSTNTDSHANLAVIYQSVTAWRTHDLVPFGQSAPIVAGIMVGHLALPALDPTGRAATFSPTLVADLLRGQLGYSGLIITDSLFMQPARAAGTPAQVALLALNAGNDIQLEPTNLPQAATALQTAMRTNPRQRALIQAAAGRVLAAKAKLNKARSHHPAAEPRTRREGFHLSRLRPRSARRS